MIGYVVLGTNDLARAASFYDALLAEMGVSRMMEFGARLCMGRSNGQADALHHDAVRRPTGHGG